MLVDLGAAEVALLGTRIFEIIRPLTYSARYNSTLKDTLVYFEGFSLAPTIENGVSGLAVAYKAKASCIMKFLFHTTNLCNCAFQPGQFLIGNLRERAALGGGKLAPALHDKADKKIELSVRHIEN